MYAGKYIESLKCQKKLSEQEDRTRDRRITDALVVEETISSAADNTQKTGTSFYEAFLGMQGG
jgi:hypothetical protein